MGNSTKKSTKIFGHTTLQKEAGSPSISISVQHDISKPEDELYISLMSMCDYNIPHVKVQALFGTEHLDFEVPPGMRADGYRIEAKIVGEEERQLFVASCQYMADMFSQLGQEIHGYGLYGASVPKVEPDNDEDLIEIETENEGENILVFKR